MNRIMNDASAPKKRGWTGDEMEMDHRREELQAAMSSRSRSSHSNTNRGIRTDTSHSDLHSDSNPSRQQLEKYPTVDLEQFYNTTVGSGYQAKGVIRQKTAHDSKIQIIDRSQRAEDGESPVARSVTNRKGGDDKIHRRGEDKDNDSDSESRSHSRGKKRKKRHSKRTRSESSSPKRRSNKRLAEKYLQCKGIRDFRKELEKILSESPST